MNIQSPVTNTPASLRAVAAWNAEKGMALFRHHHHEKNAEKASQMLTDYTRHIRTADRLQREAWLMEHRGRQSRRRH